MPCGFQAATKRSVSNQNQPAVQRKRIGRMSAHAKKWEMCPVARTPGKLITVQIQMSPIE